MGRVSAAILFALVVPVVASAQIAQEELARAFELERGGRFAEAAERYRAALARDAVNVSALLGLERVLMPIGEIESLVPHVNAAVLQAPTNRSIRAVELRMWAAVGSDERLTEAARDWMTRAPDSADPYREWARAVAKMGDTSRAQQILVQGASEIGDVLLAQDMAELSVMAGEWVPAANQWRDAVKGNTSLMPSAAASLLPAPEGVRSWVVDALYGNTRDSVGGMLAAELLLGWDQPVEGWTILTMVLPGEPQVAVGLLRRYADRARLIRTPDGALARGYALEQIARLSTGTTAERARVEAARAFVEAGNREAANRMLEQIAADAPGNRRAVNPAVSTLIGAMAESGRAEEAEARFREWEDRLSHDDISALREQIAWAWIEKGRLDRAGALLETDSSVTTLATRGWVALYGGDLRGATELFRRAGPTTGSRAEATRRTEMVALMQQIEVDTVPALGDALLELSRGDTADAVRKLERVGRSLPPAGGRGDVLGLAGRLAVERGDYRRAETVLRAAIDADPTGTSAPAAYYQLGRSYLLSKQPERAREQLEHLILTYPESAMLPLARRLLDQVRGRSS